MAFIEGIEHRFCGSTMPKTVLLEMTLHDCVGVSVVGLEYQQVVRLAFQKALGASVS